MEVTIIFNAVKLKAKKNPKKGVKYPDHTLHFAHEIIKSSQHSETISRWHWAILEKVKLHCNFEIGTPELEELDKNAISLAEAVWMRYYTEIEDEPKTKKRTLDDLYEDDEDESVFKKYRATKVASLSEMAESGSSFKLDWNSANREISVFKTSDMDAVMVESKMEKVEEQSHADAGDEDHMEICSFNKKENARPISSPHSLRKKLLRKLLLASGNYARAA